MYRILLLLSASLIYNSDCPTTPPTRIWTHNPYGHKSPISSSTTSQTDSQSSSNVSTPRTESIKLIRKVKRMYINGRPVPIFYYEKE